MTAPLHPGASDGDAFGFGEIVAIMGEIYLIGLAVLILLAAMANAANVPANFISIDDPAIAAAFTA